MGGTNIKEMQLETGVMSIRVVDNDVEFIGTTQAVMKAKLWLETHTTYLEDFDSARQKIDSAYHDIQEQTHLNYSRGGKGNRGKGRGKGERVVAVEAHRERRPYKNEEENFPSLPKPSPKEANDAVDIA